MARKKRKVIQNMCVGLEVYSEHRFKMPYSELLDKLWEEAGVTEFQLLNALQLLGRLNKRGKSRLAEMKEEMK